MSTPKNSESAPVEVPPPSSCSEIRFYLLNGEYIVAAKRMSEAVKWWEENAWPPEIEMVTEAKELPYNTPVHLPGDGEEPDIEGTLADVMPTEDELPCHINPTE